MSSWAFVSLRPYDDRFLIGVAYPHDPEALIIRLDVTEPEEVQVGEPGFHGGGWHTLTYIRNATYGGAWAGMKKSSTVLRPAANESDDHS